MKEKDPLKQFVSLRDAILAEREELITRLREIDAALNAMGVSATLKFYGCRTPTGRARNDLSLRKTVLKVLEGGKAKSKDEILDDVLKSGYQFSTDDPINSLGVVLYGKSPKFANAKGKFSVAMER